MPYSESVSSDRRCELKKKQEIFLGLWICYHLGDTPIWIKENENCF